MKARPVTPPEGWEAIGARVMRGETVARARHPRPYDDPTADEAVANVDAADRLARRWAALDPRVHLNA